MNKQTLKPIPSQGRINAFDFLRSLMIFFVIVLHVSMTYMLNTPSWWYVISKETSPVFLAIVNVLDIFMMPVLFFISGYFTPASYLRKGTVGFLKDKIRHILFPWLLGIIVIVPLFYLSLGKSMGDVIRMVDDDFLYLFIQQGHLWYLGVLFLFLFAYAFVAYFRPPDSVRITASEKKNILLLLVCMVVSAICACLSVTCMAPFDNWLRFASVFMLKPAKVITYLCLFMLGTYAWQTNWFIKGGWMPRINRWRILAISTATCYMVLKLLIIPVYYFPLSDKLIPVFDAICSFTTLMYALLTGIKLQARRIAVWGANLSPYSYGIYWVHIPPMILYLHLINEADFPILIKWISGMAVTCVFSWLISKYVLKKVPLLKNMF
ncbi:MAG: acyltransferase [Tannerellaceae bacterium]|jgi:peptidoglycan/LPS O-acetylase OafA/YrhL|nr:acyltransferase [Tannerellaceae bacterium]